MNGKGFTYLSVLLLLIVSGIALTTTSHSWRTIMQREREKELLYRGDCITKAIESYCKAGGAEKITYPSRFEDLLKDPRFPAIKRHIRKIYKDPLTEDGDWGVILGPGKGIKGVYSKSKEIPLKTGGFSDKYKEFEKAKNYSDWKFIFVPAKKKKKQG
jgi:type II secretory pathway pseudopilin PulG